MTTRRVTMLPRIIMHSIIGVSTCCVKIPPNVIIRPHTVGNTSSSSTPSMILAFSTYETGIPKVVNSFRRWFLQSNVRRPTHSTPSLYYVGLPAPCCYSLHAKQSALYPADRRRPRRLDNRDIMNSEHHLHPLILFRSTFSTKPSPIPPARVKDYTLPRASR